ncbi:hypothetical protein THAR02_05694 [Trichoderma harzianum]|uniref:Uncharacterized protein n=1 Tax=Trichoderma harzianum TaxID=5544 RepID=A0A0F9ZPI6_TRIHA|nr:hypothetical protein THAR02_05694 [Trichoderma harzianum]
MKFSSSLVVLSLSALSLAAPTPTECSAVTAADGTVTKRCNIPWTKNYGEYDEKRDLDERTECSVVNAADGTVTKRCNIPWTKNYGEYDQ